VRLAPIDRRDSYVTHVDAQIALGDPLRIETSQFRLRDGFAGRGTTSFEALDAPGQFLRGTVAGVTLAADDGSSSFARQASFIRRPGLADARATSWEAVGARRSFLLHDGDVLRVGPVGHHRGRASATFVLR
jgi:hypothetical protein